MTHNDIQGEATFKQTLIHYNSATRMLQSFLPKSWKNNFENWRETKKSVKSSSRHGRNFVALSVLLLRRPCHERRFTLHVSAALRRPVVRNKNSPHSELTSTFQRRLLVLVFLCHFGASITHR